MNKSAGARPYHMRARAVAAAATHDAILRAALRRFGEADYDQVALAEIARDAEVTVQTVLRRFGSKDGLIAAATALGVQEVRRARWQATPGNLGDVMRELIAHYEAWGARSLRLLAQEQRVAAIRLATQAGRKLHHAWVEHMFAPALAGRRGGARATLRAQLIAATDVFTWKIMRHDLGLTVKATELAMRTAVEALLR